MEAADQMSKFEEFFEETYSRNILKAVSRGERSVSVNFNDLINFNSELADELLEKPEDVIEVAEKALESNDEVSGKMKVRFSGIPESHRLMISELRQEHLGKFLELSGLIRRKSDVRPQATKSRF